MKPAIFRSLKKAFGSLFLIIIFSCNNQSKNPEKNIRDSQITEESSIETGTPENNTGTTTQPTISREPSTINLRFLDVTTGFKVIPLDVTIRQRDDKTVVRTIDKARIAENGTLTVGLPNGTYDITVIADQYDPMSSYFQLNNQSLNMNFNLDPVSEPNELSAAYIKSLHRADAIVVVGYVVDDQSGKPLEGVKVNSSDKAVTVSSGKNGFFKLLVPLPETAEKIDGRNKILFEKVQYITESRKNFDMWPNGDMILQIRMKKGTGVHEEDIIMNRKASVSIKN